MTSTVVEYFRGTIYRLYKTKNMGNESSTEKEYPNPSKPKRASGLRRSNSLKDNQTKQATTSPTKEKTSPLEQKKGIIKRSHTFSPSSMKRPTFLKFDNTSKINKPQKSINKIDKDVDNIDLNGNKSLSFSKPNETISTIQNTMEIKPIAEETFLQEHSNSTMDTGYRKDKSNTKDDRIITPNNSTIVDKTDIFDKSNIIDDETREKDIAPKTTALKEDSHKDCVDGKVEINKVAVPNINLNNGDLQESMEESLLDDGVSDNKKLDEDNFKSLLTVNKDVNVNSDEILRSVDDPNKTVNKSDNEKEMTKNIKKHSKPPDLTLDDKKRTITRRKNRYVRRSQSMKSYHELLPKLLSDDGFASISEISKAIEEREIEAGLAYKQKLNRRISDTCLVKEEHVRRSEQFSQMLNDLREKAQRDIRPLSPYAKEFISEKNSKDNGMPSPERKFKFEKSRGYFDFWMKDHNQRIDSLTKALEGNMEMRSLKETFYERCLTVPSKLLLPERPHSVKLPRRQPKIAEFRNASDSSDNEQISSVESFITSSKEDLVDHNGVKNDTNIKKIERDTKIKIRSYKRSSMISIRNSSEKLDNGIKSEIRFNTGTLRSRSKIAVVKPIQRIETDTNNNNLSDFVK